MNTAAPRPRQVSSGATLVIVGAVFVVVSAWQQLAGLHTLEVQDQLRRVLGEPSFSDLGISLDDLQGLLRVSSLVSGAVAAAMGVLGGFALRRDPRARVWLAVLAIPLVVSSLPTGAFVIAVLSVVGVAMLWSPTAGAWLHGRPLPAGPDTSSKAASADRPDRPDDAPSPAPPESTSPQTTPTGATPPTPNPYFPSRTTQPGATRTLPPVQPLPPPSPAAGAGGRGRRPAALVWACAVTWVSTAVVGGGLLLTALVLGLAGDEFFDEMRRQQPAIDSSGYSDSDLRTAIFLLAAVLVPWCVIAAGLAVMAFLGRTWARISLVVCTGLACALVLLASVSSPLLVVFLVPLALTIVLLARPEVGSWYRGESPRRL